MATGAVMGGAGAVAVIITDGAEVIAVITMVGHAAAIAAGAKTNNGEAARLKLAASSFITKDVFQISSICVAVRLR